MFKFQIRHESFTTVHFAFAQCYIKGQAVVAHFMDAATIRVAKELAAWSVENQDLWKKLTNCESILENKDGRKWKKGNAEGYRSHIAPRNAKFVGWKDQIMWDEIVHKDYKHLKW